jgi:hypothetical protein
MELNWQAFTGVAGSIQLIICPAVALMSASDAVDGSRHRHLGPKVRRCSMDR